MTKDDLDEIAKRETHCKPWGEAVTISRAERDQLVALARDGMRYRFWRSGRGLTITVRNEGKPPVIVHYAARPEKHYAEALDTAIDAEVAKEEA